MSDPFTAQALYSGSNLVALEITRSVAQTSWAAHKLATVAAVASASSVVTGVGIYSSNMVTKTARRRWGFFSGNDRKREAVMAKRRQMYRATNRARLYIKGVHTFTRKVTSGSLPWNSSTGIAFTGTGGTSKDFTVKVSLNNFTLQTGAGAMVIPIPGATDLSNLFDLYKIKSATLTLYFSTNSIGISATQYVLPIIHTSIDDTDGNAPGSETNLLQDADSRTFQFGNNGVFGRSWRPKASHTGTPSTDYCQTTAGNPGSDTQWHSLKCVLPDINTQAAVAGYFTMYLAVVYEMKDVN